MRYLSILLILFLMTIPLNGGEPEAEPVSEQNQKPLFSFGVITDVHYCDKDAEGTRDYRESLSRLQDAMNSLGTDSVAFVVNLGDIIDNDYKSYKPVMRILDDAGLKIYHCLGNHDFQIKDSKKRSIPYELPKSGYYSFSFDGFRFIFLNGNEISTYAPTNKKAITAAGEYLEQLKSEGAINAKDWNGAVSVTQMEWMMRELDESVSHNEKVFIFCHFPVYPDSEYNLFNHVELLSAIRGYNNIIAWFSGHNHAGNYGNINRTHYITAKAMVDESATTTFIRVDVYNNKIWLNGEGRERNVILAY